LFFEKFTNREGGSIMSKHYIFRNEGLWALQHLPHSSWKIKVAWADFITGLYEIFNRTFIGLGKDFMIVSHDLEKMKLQVGQKIGAYKTISIDPCIKGDINIGTSRIFLPGGTSDQGIGGRPGFQEISEQISKVPAGDYVLIEDDIFSGGTIKNIIKTFLENGVAIKKIICGIQVGNSSLDIPVDSLQKYLAEEVVDLNDPRDFLAGAYGGGLVIKNPNGKLTRVPYVLPFVDSNARSSIPRESVCLFSKKVWQLNLEFWQKFPKVKLSQTEVFFFEALKLWGYSGSESMIEVCQNILQTIEAEEISLDIGDKKGMVFIDLNGTLITHKSHKLNISGQELRQSIIDLQKRRWLVGLCSDSPHSKLKEWGEYYGICGPILSENGKVLNGKPISQETFPIFEVKSQIAAWARAQSVAMLPAIYAPEFGQKISGSGIAFGAGRISSISVFCLKYGHVDVHLSERLGKWLSSVFNPSCIDCSPEYGFVAVHFGENFRFTKGQALRSVGLSLYKRGKKCWHIGDSNSDIICAPVLCHLAAVGNASRSAKLSATLMAKNKFTRGVVELLQLIE
jgi:hydroxymethylpyrimidine pyrophosphatase-like HAD family hydrolase